MFPVDIEKFFKLFIYDAYDPLLFSSALFLFLFLFLLIIYKVVSPFKSLRVTLLILFSLFFYYKSGGYFFLLIILTSIINYYSAIWLNTPNEKLKRLIYISGISANILLLGYFKYTDFFISIINDIGTKQFDPINIILPIGISFYIFKAISYLTDVYWELLEPEKNFLDFTLYLVFFGNILAGPIDRASAFLPQIKKEYSVSKKELAAAVLLIISGLIKKVVIADYISINFVDRVFEFPTRFSGIENLLAVYGYSLQIYCDFSGYTDLALGISLLLGFKLMENFNFPYKATSVADFWRRWHISLSTWLLEYLFRPLQIKFRNLKLWGNVIALLITFILCGFWHGASWTFIFWGFLHGFFMAFSVATAKPRKRLLELSGLSQSKLLPALQGIITFNLISFAWIFFRTPSFEYAGDMIDQIFSFFRPGILPQFINGYPIVFFLIITGYFLHFLPKSLEFKTVDFLSRRSIISLAFLLAIFIWIAAQVKSSELQPFLYFQF